MNRFIKNLLIYMGIILFVMIASRLILNVALTPMMVLSFGLLSLVMGLIPAASNHFGKKMFTRIYLMGTLIGLMYMTYIAWFQTADGWSDLVSLAGLFTFTAIGLGVGILVEAIVFIRMRLKK